MTTTRPDSDQQRHARRRAMLASFLGTAVEYYDFILYGSAASLVFPQLFFSQMTPLLATLSSFATMAVGYFIRPIGGIVFGHFGDILGRKRMLVITILIMGISSFCMGLLPTQQQIGASAAVFLLALRLVQGFAVGGEWAGAALMSLEHAAPRGRGFAASAVSAGGPCGAVLATIALAAFSALPEDQFLSWGWRVPFLLSALLVVVGIVLRIAVPESPEFAAAQAAADAANASAAKTAPATIGAAAAPAAKKRAPIVVVLTRYPKEWLSTTVGGLAPMFLQGLINAFMLTYAVIMGHTRTEALVMITIANAIHVFNIPLCAAISDRVGRRPVMVTGAVIGLAVIVPVFWLIGQSGWWTLLLAFILANIAQAVMYGPMAAWISEQYPTEARYSGVSLSFQMMTTIGAGLAPLVATALLAAAGGTSPLFINLLFMGLCVISGIVFLASRETAKSELRRREQSELYLGVAEQNS